MNPTSIASALALILSALCSQAASPVLSKILPRGGKLGAEHELHFYGDRMADAAG